MNLEINFASSSHYASSACLQFTAKMIVLDLPAEIKIVFFFYSASKRKINILLNFIYYSGWTNEKYFNWFFDSSHLVRLRSVYAAKWHFYISLVHLRALPEEYFDFWRYRYLKWPFFLWHRVFECKSNDSTQHNIEPKSQLTQQYEMYSNKSRSVGARCRVFKPSLLFLFLRTPTYLNGTQNKFTRNYVSKASAGHCLIDLSSIKSFSTAASYSIFGCFYE